MDQIRHSRHESCSKGLPEQSDHGVEAGQVCAKSGAQGEETSEKGDGREEEGDQEEDPEEAGHEEELASIECSGKAGSATKVALRVEGKSGHSSTAVAVQAIDNTANLEVGPSGWVASGTCSSGVDLEEVGLVEWSDVGNSSQDDEELEENSSCDNEEGDESQDGALMRVSCVTY